MRVSMRLGDRWSVAGEGAQLLCSVRPGPEDDLRGRRGETDRHAGREESVERDGETRQKKGSGRAGVCTTTQRTKHGGTALTADPCIWRALSLYTCSLSSPAPLTACARNHPCGRSSRSTRSRRTHARRHWNARCLRRSAASLAFLCRKGERRSAVRY